MPWETTLNKHVSDAPCTNSSMSWDFFNKHVSDAPCTNSSMPWDFLNKHVSYVVVRNFPLSITILVVVGIIKCSKKVNERPCTILSHFIYGQNISKYTLVSYILVLATTLIFDVTEP